MNCELWQLRIDMTAASGETESTLLDTLVSWCEECCFFIGRRRNTFVIYAPLVPMSASHQKQLMHMLEHSEGISSFKLSAAGADGQQGADFLGAYIEAVSNFQRFLGEVLSESAETLTTCVQASTGN